MPRFRVRDGQEVAHAGTVLSGGAFLELPRHVAEDPAVCGSIVEVDADGKPVAPPPADDLARFRAHERVSILRERRAAKQAELAAIDAQLTAEEEALAAAVAAAAKPAAAKPASTPQKPTAPGAPVKE